eukprot:304855-Pleurochrysis_carterae.AAC.2
MGTDGCSARNRVSNALIGAVAEREHLRAPLITRVRASSRKTRARTYGSHARDAQVPTHARACTRALRCAQTHAQTHAHANRSTPQASAATSSRTRTRARTRTRTRTRRARAHAAHAYAYAYAYAY